MAILNSDHLLDLAEALLKPPSPGAPRQAGLRRAVSSAYYGVFHFTLTRACDEFIGVSKRSTPEYRLCYRSIEHGRIREVCADAAKPKMPLKYKAYLPAAMLGAEIQAFSEAFIDLQEKRHAADYDPSARFRLLDARVTVETARTALRRFGDAPGDDCRTFLALLLFRPR